MDKPLQDRIAIVTGAAGDIGKAISRRFADAGAKVAVVDRKPGLDKDFRATDFLPLACDLTDPAQIKDAVARTVKHYGALHIVVNNAAAETGRKPLAELPLEEWNAHFAVNVTAAFLMAQAAIPHMKAAGGGVILNIASQLGSVAAVHGAAYSASKAAVISLTRSIAADHAAEGIRGVALSPGAVMTSRLTSRYGGEEAVNKLMAHKHPIGRLGTAKEVAEAALFLVGPGATFFAGSDVVMDGGFTAV